MIVAPELVEHAAMVAAWSPSRMAKARAISAAARRLAAERGFDDFSLDDLADAAGVSRRTLFNYFPGKVDAVLGLPPRSAHALLEEFRRGGPTGDLLDDAVRVVHHLVSAKDMGKQDWAQLGCALERSPRLLAAATTRFRAAATEVAALTAQREQLAPDDAQATVLVGLLGAVLDASVAAFVRHPGEATLGELFDHHLAAARRLFTDLQRARAATPG